MPLYLGTDDYGAKNMVHFFKIFPPGVYLRDSFEKGQKTKKTGLVIGLTININDMYTCT
jgi:hypothetical protein